MPGYRSKYQTAKTQESYYLEGLAVTTSVLIGRSKRYRDAKFIAYGMKRAMERFAEQCEQQDQLERLYERYPEIKNLILEAE